MICLIRRRAAAPAGRHTRSIGISSERNGGSPAWIRPREASEATRAARSVALPTSSATAPALLAHQRTSAPSASRVKGTGVWSALAVFDIDVQHSHAYRRQWSASGSATARSARWSRSCAYLGSSAADPWPPVADFKPRTR